MSTLPLYADESNSDVVIIAISKGQYAIVDHEDADLANVKY